VRIVATLLADDAVEHRPAGSDPAGAKSRAHGLRERVDVDHVAGRQRSQRPRVVALEAQVAVDAVLEDEETVLARELDEPLAALG
jgi:hypothetical protein